MAEKCFLLNAGHGGMLAGEYLTPGKRSPTWRDGSVLYEGEFNRAITSRIAESLTFLRIKYINIAPTDSDWPLTTRIDYVNLLCEERKENMILLDIHANAGGGSGFEVYTSKGETLSDKYATVFAEEFKKEFPQVKIRSDCTDGDVDKEATFAMLKYTKCPAVTLESFFMDNEEECKRFLMQPWQRDRIAWAYVEAIKRINSGKI